MGTQKFSVNSIAVKKLYFKIDNFNDDKFLSFDKLEGKEIMVSKMLTRKRCCP